MNRMIPAGWDEFLGGDGWIPSESGMTPYRRDEFLRNGWMDEWIEKTGA